MRNTDSFFKDDTVETKKISLTPNLLRDENSSGEAKEVSIYLTTFVFVETNQSSESWQHGGDRQGAQRY